MRPRVFPAEDEQPPCASPRRPWPASMRPRVFPAEDAADIRAAGERFSRFNEAAGIPRGRRTARNPLRAKEVRHWIARGRAIANDERPLTPWG